MKNLEIYTTVEKPGISTELLIGYLTAKIVAGSNPKA
jgi:hypothetical protein